MEPENPLSREQALKEEKLTLEISKLQIENRELSKPWYRRLPFYATILPAGVTLVLLFFGFKNDYIQMKMEVIANQDKQLKEIELKIARRDSAFQQSASLLSKQSDSLELSRKTVRDQEKNLKQLESELTVHRSLINRSERQLAERKKMLEQEETIIEVRHYIKSIINLEGRYADNETTALIKLIKDKDPAQTKQTTQVLMDSLQSKKLSHNVKGLLYRILIEATSERKWLDDLLSLYAEHCTEVDRTFLRNFFYLTVRLPDSTLTDDQTEARIVNLFFACSHRVDLTKWRLRHLYYSMGAVMGGVYYTIDQSVYLEKAFGPALRQRLESDLRIFVAEMCTMPKKYSTPDEDYIFDPDPNPIRYPYAYELEKGVFLLYLLKSKYLPEVLVSIFKNISMSPTECDLFKRYVESINSDSAINNNNGCQLTPLPNVTDSKEVWTNWINANSCYLTALSK